MRHVTDNPDVTDQAPREPAGARSSDTKSEDKSGDMPAMLDQALEPVLTELGHVRTRLEALEQAQPAATPPATAQPAPAPAAAPAPAPAPVKSKWNGNGLGIWVQIAVLTIMATIYVAGFTQLGNQIRAVNDRVDATRTEVIARVDATRAEVIARIDATNARIEALTERVHAIEVRLSELFARLDALARGQLHTDQRLARVEGTLDLPPLPQPPLTDIDSN